jgi:hypothetical protein
MFALSAADISYATNQQSVGTDRQLTITTMHEMKESALKLRNECYKPPGTEISRAVSFIQKLSDSGNIFRPSEPPRHCYDKQWKREGKNSYSCPCA